MDRASRVADALLYGIPVPVDGKSWEADLRMVCVKLARAVENPANRDNYVDAAGYIELAYQARPE